MKRRFYKLTKLLLLLAFSLASVVSCYQPIPQKIQTASEPTSDCRIIQHTFGETCVPLKPESIIALSPVLTLDPLIALGITPTGFATYSHSDEEYLLGVSFNELEEVERVGDASQPSLEKILSLEPDLILTTDYGEDDRQYRFLSEIAPTVSVPNESHMSPIDLENSPQFKDNLLYVANILGQEAKADEILRQYQERIKKLKKQLGNQLQTAEVSVIFDAPSGLWTISKGTYPISHILDDIGIRYKSVPHGEWNLSIETIDKYDSDILFIVDVTQKGESFYFHDSIFATLDVVKNGRAYLVDQEAWRSHGILGANKILDDLFKYLPNAMRNLQPI